MLFKGNLTFQTSYKYKSRTFVIPFAVSNIKYNILGTPLFEEHVNSLNVGLMSLTFKIKTNSHINMASFTADN